MRIASRSRFAVVALLCVLLGALPLVGQTANTGAITGTVTDQTGASVPNATVTVTNTATNQSRSVTTDAAGVYRVPLLDPGTYRVRITAQGFKTTEVGAVTVAVTETATLDRSLEVGAQTEQVTVEASVETVQTATSSLGTTVTGQTITSLPLSTRNFTQVLGMSTGVAVDVAQGSAFGRGSQNMSVNGASPDKNNFQMDGVAINNAAGNNSAGDAGLYTGIAIPNPDALQEFKIQTSTYDASFGRNPGANVNVITKSGTNQFHGTLFEYFRNEKLNANDFFYNRDNPASRTTKQVLKQNQFGGTIGGKIITDKLFFFGSYQGTRQRNGVAPQGITSATLFPIPAGDRGTTALNGVDNAAAAIFRQNLQAAMCQPGVPRGARGSLCSDLAVGGSGATNLPINDVAMRILQVKLPDGSYYIPGSGAAGTAQRLFSIPGRYSEDQYLANVDWIPSAKHTVQMKYMFSDNPFIYQLQGQLPGRIQSDARGNTSALLRLTSILTPSVVNQARISFQRIIQNGTDTVPYTPQQIGLKPLVDITCCNGTTGGTYTQPPPMNIIGAFNIGGGLNPSFAPTNQTQYSDQLSWTKGSHTFRTGFEYENIRYPLVFGGLGRGFLFLNSFPDFLIGRAGCAPGDATCTPANPGNTTGTNFSSFTNCLFCVRSGVNGIIHNYNLRNMNAFFQDDWKVNSKLTLNLGVRWEYNGVLSDKYGNLTNFWQNDLRSVPLANIPSAPSQTDPNAFIGYVVPSNYDSRPISQGGRGPLPPGVRQFDGLFTSFNRVPLSNFAPRIGFAWTPLATNRLVVRGGFGLFYDRIGINRMVHAVQEGRPYADTTGIDHAIASLQSPYQDRPLALLPRWFNFNTLQGSAFNSPFYDRVQTPLVRQYNLGFQYEFIQSYVLEVAFVGSSGINIANYNHNINAARIATAANPVNGITTTTGGNANARVPFLGFLGNGFQQNGFDAVYNYSSLQTTVRKNFSRGLGFQAAYTWSKNLSNVGFDAANLNLSTDLWQQYGQTPYSRPHRFVLSYQYELPFKAGGALNQVIGGWSISGLTTIQSGNPITFTDTRGGSAFGMGFSGTIENGVGRAQMAPGVNYGQIATSGDVKDRLGRIGVPNTTVKRFFDPAAFATNANFPAYNPDGTLTTLGACPTCATGFGNSGVGVVRGPHQLNFDFSVNKMFRINERHTVQFRTDFFNLFNHAQFALTSAGNIGGANIQANNANNFGVITGTSVNPRLVQFALRYQF
jgi:hypothetical protein